MTERNTDLFFAVAEAIEDDPRRYCQDSWYDRRRGCGTTACIAGWAAAIVAKAGDLNRARRAWDDDPLFLASDIAQDALGLTDDEAYDLFNATWQPHDGLSVPDALRKIGEGAEIEDVTDPGTIG